MKYNSNFVHIDSNGTTITEAVNKHDPFTQLTYGITTKPGFVNVSSNRNCTCHDCYVFSSVEIQCDTCTSKKICDSLEDGCLFYDPYQYNGPSCLIFNMLKRPFIVGKEDDVKSIPAILPHIPMYDLVSRPHLCQYNVLCIEFNLCEAEYIQLVSKVFSVPYIGEFALYPKYNTPQEFNQWVLLIPLDHCVSYHHWRALNDWLCNELEITNICDPHFPTPCPAVASFVSSQYERYLVCNSESYHFPALLVIDTVITARNTNTPDKPDSINILEYFISNYDWRKLLLELGFYPTNDTDWRLPKSSELKPTVRVLDNKLYQIDDQNNVIESTAKNQLDVFIESNKLINISEVFDLLNSQTVLGTGMTVTEYNRSLVGLFTPEQQYNDSVAIKSGSQGWDEEEQWIIEGQYQANSLNMVFGPSGSFKSFYATDLAACVATGTSWGTYSVTQGNVLYIAAEGDSGLSKRIKAWELTHKQETHKLFRIGQPLSITEPHYFNQLLNVIDDICRDHGDIRMIVIDTLARCFGSGDENNTKDMGVFITACDNLKQKTKAAILLVHHTGKTTTRGARGNSSLKAALDSEFKIDRKHNALTYSLVCTKQKDAEPAPTQVIKLVKVNLSATDDNSSLCRPFNPEEESKTIKITQFSDDANTVVSIIKTFGGSCYREQLKEHFSNQQTKPTSDSSLRTRLTRAIQKLEKENVISVDKKQKKITLV